MSNNDSRIRYRPIEFKRDHARPINAPSPSNVVITEGLAELVTPATYALMSYYHSLALRSRILNLPIMVALVLTLIWRQVPGVAELARLAGRETLLWAPLLKVSQQALNQRLRCFPADLFREILEAILPVLRTRASARSRPQPSAVVRATRHFSHIWIVDATTLEELFNKVGLLREAVGKVLGGKVLALLDLPSKLPVHVWMDKEAAANEKSFLDRLESVLEAGTLLLFDKGFYSFPFFDWLTEHGVWFVTRARTLSAYSTVKVLTTTPQVREGIIAFGKYRSNPCAHPVRLIEVSVGGAWRSYLTNVLDPTILSAVDVLDLYGRRWRIEEAFMIAKRLLSLSYLWTGALNGIEMQVWATWLLYAVLIDLSDAVAQELNLPLDQISLEMVYRGLYHFTVAYTNGQANDPVAYFAAPAQRDLGIVKQKRKKPRKTLDKLSKPLT